MEQTLATGNWLPEYVPVIEAFCDANLTRPAGGSSMTIYTDGKRVVNVRYGEAREGKPFTANTLSGAFSCTKGLLSILANRLVQEGKLDLEAPVGRYWPEFAQAGKGEIPVKWLLQHRAGLSAVRDTLTLEEILDVKPVVDALAAQEPLWAPGTGYGYHSITFGHLIGELIFRVTGVRVGEYFQQVIARPLNLQAYMGLPAEEFKKVAEFRTDGKRVLSEAPIGSSAYWVERAFTFGGALPIEVAGRFGADGFGPNEGSGFNDPRIWATEMPGANGIMTSDALARAYSACVVETDGIRLLDDATIENAMMPASFGQSVWGEPGPWAARGLGFMIQVPGFRDMISEKSFGHDGLGGQLGMGDLKHRVGFAYLSSYLGSGETEMTHLETIGAALRGVLAELDS